MISRFIDRIVHRGRPIVSASRFDLAEIFSHALELGLYPRRTMSTASCLTLGMCGFFVHAIYLGYYMNPSKLLNHYAKIDPEIEGCYIGPT